VVAYERGGREAVRRGGGFFSCPRVGRYLRLGVFWEEGKDEEEESVPVGVRVSKLGFCFSSLPLFRGGLGGGRCGGAFLGFLFGG